MNFIISCEKAVKMSVFIKHYLPGRIFTVSNYKIWRPHSTAADSSLKKDEEEEEFRVLDILKKRERTQRRVVRRSDVQPDRADRMATNQVNTTFSKNYICTNTHTHTNLIPRLVGR